MNKSLRHATTAFTLLMSTQLSNAQAIAIDAPQSNGAPPVTLAQPDYTSQRVKVGLSSAETTLVLPWFVEELIATANASRSLDEAAHDYAGRLKRGL
ncbi:hypothetical protein [Burkholderia contaminans]|uniref:hypothetical protein n=1 Tax=Burkholderia contaminans TaxID=488447 RepID=UPI0009E44D45|nr:hypothetical protein [Burkholderia contaminans]MEB4636817.1 hypothetical protein [Burkholderia contaminans]MEB4651640.1 hypothetical protein [Burkholderia contaminans]MEB4661211.1 hypothetical protein [Burkholderia contaminans]MEB4667179.1 hypothetical protein [Burkholderia contaminans]MEB4678441.1 hypothetical protein [Burkholderia contaminans]